jgi:hypothetical protein
MSVRSGSDWLAGWLRPIDIFLTLTMFLVRSPALCCGFVVYFLGLFSYLKRLIFLGGLFPSTDVRFQELIDGLPVCDGTFIFFTFCLPSLAGRMQGYWCLNWSSLRALSSSRFDGSAEKLWVSEARILRSHTFESCILEALRSWSRC